MLSFVLQLKANAEALLTALLLEVLAVMLPLIG